MPTILRAPEIILGHPWGFPVDVWSVCCLALELITVDTIFNIDRTADTTHTDVHLARIAKLLGPFPPQFLEVYTRRAEHFNPSGHLLHPPRLPSARGSLTERLARAGLSNPELVQASDFIHRALQVDPGRSSFARDNRAFGRCLAARVTISVYYDQQNLHLYDSMIACILLYIGR